MGNEKEHIFSGIFTNEFFDSLTPQVTINGVTGHIIFDSRIKDPSHSPLPVHSQTSDVYFNPGKDGKAKQCIVYDKNHNPVLDINWSHAHTNKGDGKSFKKGMAHVHVFYYGSDKKWHRDPDARPLTVNEKVKYGPIIHHFNDAVVL